MTRVLLNCILAVLDVAELSQARKQGDFTLSELFIGSLVNCILVVLNVVELSQALADLYAG